MVLTLPKNLLFSLAFHSIKYIRVLAAQFEKYVEIKALLRM